MSLQREANPPKTSNKQNYYRNRLRELRAEEKARNKQKTRDAEAFQKLKAGGN